MYALQPLMLENEGSRDSLKAPFKTSPADLRICCAQNQSVGFVLRMLYYLAMGSSVLGSSSVRTLPSDGVVCWGVVLRGFMNPFRPLKFSIKLHRIKSG